MCVGEWTYGGTAYVFVKEHMEVLCILLNGDLLVLCVLLNEIMEVL